MMPTSLRLCRAKRLVTIFSVTVVVPMLGNSATVQLCQFGTIAGRVKRSSLRAADCLEHIVEQGHHGAQHVVAEIAIDLNGKCDSLGREV